VAYKLLASDFTASYKKERKAIYLFSTPLELFNKCNKRKAEAMVMSVELDNVARLSTYGTGVTDSNHFSKISNQDPKVLA
jgi:hypothetical protein